ncbi:MAG: carboxypeptidase-like regulatory domain-containing protein, partial [Bacteroidota bacterium]
MKIRFLVLALIALAPFFDILGQSRTITGTVTSASDSSPLPGVSVVEKGTTNGTQTDFDGKYSLEISENAKKLVFSYFGKAKEVQIDSQTVIDVALEDNIATTEVVVTGYQTSKKRRKSKRKQASLASTLSGQVAGLNITNSSGNPGANSKIVLRGVGSLSESDSPQQDFNTEEYDK